MPKITLVKKILTNGQPCRKCIELLRKLEASGHLDKIDKTVIAQEGNPQSEGFLLAELHNQESAPFFIIEHQNGNTETVSTYGDFLQIALGLKLDAREIFMNKLDKHNDLDFL